MIETIKNLAQREQHTVDLDRPQRNGQYHTSQYPSQGNLATAGITNIGTVINIYDIIYSTDTVGR